MFEQIIREHVFIDFGAEVHYGSDQMNLDYPVRFATVGFQLMDDALLSGIVDRIRKDEGFTPFHPMDEYTDVMCDQEGWYDFFISINDWDSTRTGTCIEAVVCNSRSSDEGEMYTIDLSPEEQGLLFCRLDEQCRQYLGKGCMELLTEARKEMSLNKAVQYGKEKRKPYRGSKATDRTCRNHGSCLYCRGNRLHKFRKSEWKEDEY